MDPQHADELARVQAALEIVYGHHASSQRKAADAYLVEFQSKASSLDICFHILEDSISSSFKFFAAVTIHSRLRNTTVPNLPAVRDALVRHLSQAVDDALRLRLASCVATLAIAMRWTILDDLFRLDHADAAAGGGDSNRNIILSILKVLPEECANDRYAKEEDRIFMRDHLIASANVSVFSFLLLQQHDIPSTLKILFVWIRFVPLPADAMFPMLELIFASLTNVDTVELGTDVLCELFRMYSPAKTDNQNLSNALIRYTLHLPLEQALSSGNEDICTSYCRIWTELGESYLMMILPESPPSDWNPELPQRLLENILRCSEYPDSEISGMTLYLWYRLIGDLDQNITDYRWRQELIDLYTRHLLRLVDVCVKIMMRYPDDVEDFAEDMLEDLERHRLYVEETVEDCCRLLGGHIVLNTIGQSLRREERSTKWQGTESCLSCLAAIHRFVPSDEAEILPYALLQMPRLADPSHPIALRKTCHMVIGRYAAWLSHHTELLQPLLPILSQGLAVPETAHSSARAIQELCDHSNAQFSIAEPVLLLFEEWTPGRLKIADELLLLEGVCKAASRKIADDRSDGRDILTRLAQPMGNRLAAHLADPNASARWVEAELDRLTTLIRTLKSESTPIVELIQSAWPLLELTIQRFPQDCQLAEKTCRFHKHSIRSCGPKAYAPLFDALVKQLVDCFHATRVSSFLYCASICVSDFGNDAKYTDRLNAMLASLSSTAFSMLQELENFTNHPDIVEEYFYLVERVVNYIPGSLTDRIMVSSLVRCATIGMQVDHKGANKGTLKFIASLLSFGLQARGATSPAFNAVEHALTENGPMIVRHLIRALSGTLPCYSKEIPDIIWKLNTLCPGFLIQWATEAFAQEPKIPETFRSEFINSLTLGLSRGELRFSVEAFQDACYRERRHLQQP